MSKITYLFGAGASKETMPLAIDMSNSMIMIAEKIEDFFYYTITRMQKNMNYKLSSVMNLKHLQQMQ